MQAVCRFNNTVECLVIITEVIRADGQVTGGCFSISLTCYGVCKVIEEIIIAVNLVKTLCSLTVYYVAKTLTCIVIETVGNCFCLADTVCAEIIPIIILAV